MSEDPVSGAAKVVTAGGTPMIVTEPSWLAEFRDLKREWRRLFSELIGTYLLLVAAVGPVMVDGYIKGSVGRAAAVTAPGLMVAAMILFMGTVSGAHLNPVVTLAFALRREFPWRRVPGYLVAQIVGAVLAPATLWAILGKVGSFGMTELAAKTGVVQGISLECILTFGLVSTILGTASGAQNVGALSAFAVGGYIVLAGLWESPVTGASMNPFRSLGPAIVAGNYTDIGVYIAGPLLGALLAVGAAYILRGPGGDPVAARAAQGTLEPVFVRLSKQEDEPR
jgi:aquaporin Z